MRRKQASEDIASEPLRARGDDANGTFCSMKKELGAILCRKNRWRYRIQAVTEKGFELKLTLFVVAFASMQLAT